MTDFEKATREFERWMRRHIAVVSGQLADKHRLMAETPVQFLRGTFYRWAQLFPKVCPELNRGPSVLAVGDLHLASFGTWRDGFGRLIWGIDDFDEAHPLPYANDLVRLAVSAMIDAKEGEIQPSLRNVIEVILDGYRSGLRSGGEALVLEEQHKWLRKIALDHLDVPAAFWKKMDDLPSSRTGIPAGARAAIAQLLPLPDIQYRVARRIAGIGSLGHPRYVAIFDWLGSQIALEAKAAVPSACSWAKSEGDSRIYYQDVMEKAIRCPDPYVRLQGKWLVRQLSPDSSPIEMEAMSGLKNQDRLLHAMAWEAANIHLGTSHAADRILASLDKGAEKQLRAAVKDMTVATVSEWKEWKKTRRDH